MDDSDKNERDNVKKSTDLFFLAEGRRPRLLLGALTDQKIESLNYLSSSMADLGFDIDIASMNLNPSQLMLQAQENDVHGVVIQVASKNLSTIQTQLDQYLSSSSDDETQIFLQSNSIIEKISQGLRHKQVSLISDDLSPVQTAVFILDKLS